MPTSRRNVLKTIASAAAVSPLAGQHEHHAANEFVQISAAKPTYKPKFFSPAQFATLQVLVDLIIPRTDTPGAADAGAHRIIDTSVSRNKVLQTAWRDGLQWLHEQSKNKPFPAISQDEQVAILTAASNGSDTKGMKFFTLLKGATVDAYYSTQEGLTTELGWNANTFLPEFKGCTHKEHQS
ncbi:MAG TPA: gluconate 2-dehydrogenase subunit 3 family protein [Bryobacteraceae bacterium]|nr:gluconate 2-dehydrogenase subunit 3 family protein [Bryobacteraceae bacterium]